MKQVMRFHQQEEKMMNINVSNNKNPLTQRQKDNKQLMTFSFLFNLSGGKRNDHNLLRRCCY